MAGAQRSSFYVCVYQRHQIENEKKIKSKMEFNIRIAGAPQSPQWKKESTNEYEKKNHLQQQQRRRKQSKETSSNPFNEVKRDKHTDIFASSNWRRRRVESVYNKYRKSARDV